MLRDLFSEIQEIKFLYQEPDILVQSILDLKEWQSWALELGFNRNYGDILMPLTLQQTKRLNFNC